MGNNTISNWLAVQNDKKNSPTKLNHRSLISIEIGEHEAIKYEALNDWVSELAEGIKVTQNGESFTIDYVNLRMLLSISFNRRLSTLLLYKLYFS